MSNMHAHKSNRDHVADAITGIKTLSTHEERVEAFLLLNAEINARLLDSVETLIDEVEDLAAGASAEIAASDP
jgi:hypothetical protein